MADEAGAGEAAAGGDKKYLNLVVRNQLGEEVQFKVKLTTKFQKIFDAYNEKKGVSGHKFLVDGHRIHGHMTPAEVDMEDGDSIDAVLEQLGGGNCAAAAQTGSCTWQEPRSGRRSDSMIH